jgi:hypothetical protein
MKLLTLAIALMAPWFALHAAVGRATTPNIVVILSDDYGSGSQLGRDTSSLSCKWFLG